MQETHGNPSEDVLAFALSRAGVHASHQFGRDQSNQIPHTASKRIVAPKIEKHALINGWFENGMLSLLLSGFPSNAFPRQNAPTV